MAAAGLDAVIVPRADAYQGEYVADCDARLCWLTGFSGSAGFAIVTADRAGVFIDGRYRVQVRAETDPAIVAPVPWPETSAAAWLREALPQGGVLGLDPWLHTRSEVEALALLRETLAAELSRILRLPAGSLAVEAPLAGLGLDSLGGMELRTALEGRLGMPVPLSAVTETLTLDLLARRIAEAVRAARTEAGVMALIVASVGFIAKLFAEAIEEISLKQVEAVRATGAGFLSTLIMGVQPQVLPRFIGFATYQLDSNLRNSTMVGIVGGGGIGATLFTAYQRFDFDVVLAILIVIVALIMVAEIVSGWARKVFQ